MCHQTFNPNFLTKKLRNIVLFYELIDKFPKLQRLTLQFYLLEDLQPTNMILLGLPSADSEGILTVMYPLKPNANPNVLLQLEHSKNSPWMNSTPFDHSISLNFLPNLAPLLALQCLPPETQNIYQHPHRLITIIIYQINYLI